MEYEWEKKKKFKQAVSRAMLAADLNLPDGFGIAGISVINKTHVEAAYISLIEPEDDIYTMDIMRDIAGDANRLYEECFSTHNEEEFISDDEFYQEPAQ